MIKGLLRNWLWIAGLILISAGFLALVLPANRAISNSPSSKTQTNLITGQDWSDFSGASVTAAGVKIQPLGRAIVNQDGSPNQDNPPVNVRGPHLSFDGNIEVDLKLSGIAGKSISSFYLYSAVPIIYDEWRYQPPQLRLDLSQNKITLYEWNGQDDSPSLVKSWTAAVSGSDYLTIDIGKQSKTASFQLNGKTIGQMPAGDTFSSGQIWFGADASLGSGGWTLRSLSAQVASGKLTIISGAALKAGTSEPQSLRSLASANPRRLPIGAAIADYALFSDSDYRNLVATQFDMLVPENDMKPQFIHPQPNVYNFKEADSLVDFALANGMTVHGHTLEFSEANPAWMQQSPLSQRQQILTDHIKTVVSHFGGKVNEWDVVDEPLSDDDNDNGDSTDLRQNIWTAAMGEKYIDVSFAAAHAANPNAQLYINEYGLEADGSRWDEFLALLHRLQARGVPINGVGFQAHIHEQGDEIDTATLVKHMQILAAMGLKSRISEIDVYGDSPQHQADQYAATLKACLDASSCTSFTTWGVTDKYGSTTDIHNYPLNYGNDLIWDSNLQPKLAYSSLQNTLR